MKQIKLMAAALVIIISAASCSKSKTDMPAPPSPPVVQKKLKQTIYTFTGYSPETETITYDSQGRFATYTDYSSDRHYEFDYTSTTILNVARKKQSDGTPDQTIECTLNGSGAITKMVFKAIPGGAVTYTYEYTYNMEGYMTKVKGYNSGSLVEEDFVIENGNAVSSKLYHNGVQSSNRQYFYDNTKSNLAYFGAWTYWPSVSLFGKPSKNYPIEGKTFDMNNVLTWHAKKTYEFDANNYPVKVTNDYVLEGTKGVYTLTYE